MSAEVPVSVTAAGNRANNVSASTLVANPDFGIVFTDDTTHPGDSVSECAQSSSLDPLCVDIVKVEPDCSQIISDNTNAVSDDLVLGLEKQINQPLVEAPPLNNVLTDEIPGDTSCQSCINDHDPLQLDIFKDKYLERVEGNVNSRAAASMQTVPQLDLDPVSSSPSPASIANVEDFSDPTSQLDDLVDIKDNIAGFEYTEISRCHAQSEAVETTEPFQITNVSSPTVNAPESSASTSQYSEISNVLPASLPSTEPRSQNRGKKHKCPICNSLMAEGDLPEHIKSHETSVVQTQRARRQGVTPSPPKTLPCTECSFKANSTTELSEHLEQHEDEEAGRNRTMVPAPLSDSTQRSVASTSTSTSIVSYLIPVLQRTTNVPLVVNLDDEKSNSGPAVVLENSSSSAAQLVSSRNEQQSEEPLTLFTLLRGSGEYGTSRSSVPQNSTINTNTLNIPIITPSQDASNGRQNYCLTPPSQGSYQQQTVDLTFSNLLRKMGHNGASNITTTQGIPAYQSAGQSGDHPPQPGSSVGDSRGTVIHQSDIANQSLDNQQEAQLQGPLLRQTVGPPTTHGTSEADHQHDLSASIPVNQPAQSLLRAAPPQADELRPCQPLITDSPKKVLPDTDTSTTHQSILSPPKKVSVIILSPLRETSVICLPGKATQLPLFNPANCEVPGQPKLVSANAAPPLETPSNLTSFQTTPCLLSSSLNQSHLPPKPSGCTEGTTNEGHSSNSSQVPSPPAKQTEVMAATPPLVPMPPPSSNCTNISQKSMSILSRIERLIETNANVLKSNQVKKRYSSVSSASTRRPRTSRSASPRSLLRSTDPVISLRTDLNTSPIVEARSDSTNSPSSFSQAVNLNASPVLEARTGSTNSASSSSRAPCSTAGTPVQALSGSANSIPGTSVNSEPTANTIAEVHSSECVSTNAQAHSHISNPILSSSQDNNLNPTACPSIEPQMTNKKSIQKPSDPKSLNDPNSTSSVDLPVTESSGSLPYTGVITSNSTALDQATASRNRSENTHGSSAVVIDMTVSDVSDNSNDPEPVDSPARRGGSSKNSSDDDFSSSDEFTAIDPNYVPPSRERLPVKTPDHVLEAIPSYEHWIRSQFVGADSDPEKRPENDCIVCGRKFDTQELLKEHREKRYSEFKCCKCPFKTVTARLLKGHTNKHARPKPYECKECGLSFVKRGLFVKHFLGHRGDYYYKCDICGMGFHEYTPYEGHVNKHRNITPYQCVKCNIAFHAKSNLQDHKKRKHKRIAYTQCTVCRKFIGKHWLADHMKRHEINNSRMFLCEQCGCALKSKLSLTRHMMNHSGERPYVCTYCGAAFKVPSALKSHERKHTGERPYKCEVCGKTFTFNTPYTYHLRTHTGERPYKCEYCGMTFAQPSPYAVHKRLHTGERPYKCKICPEAFPSHASVRNHMLTHANSFNGTGRKRTRRTKAEMENEENDEPAKRKTKRRSKAMVKDESGDSEDDSTEEVPSVPVQPSRRSERQTKCTKSFVEEKGESDSESTSEDSLQEKNETI